MASLAEIRAKLAAQQQNAKGNSNSDKTLFAHWNIEEGQSALVRFLPDGNSTNDFFWVERLQIKLPFAGIKGKSDKHTTVVVPCMEQWGESCPVLTEIRPWFKDKSLEEVARKYWKKRSYILQGFVRENPTDEDDMENPIRKFIFTPELFKLVREGIMDPEIDEIPTHSEQGLDFRVKKGSKGGYPDYGTSGWSRRSSALTMQENDAIEKFGLNDLSVFLPKKPSDVELQAIKELFAASVDGELYDADKWGNYYRPYGMDEASAASVAAHAAANKTTVTTKPVHSARISNAQVDLVTGESSPTVEMPSEIKSEETQPAGDGNKKAQDILNMIRSRKQS